MASSGAEGKWQITPDCHAAVRREAAAAAARAPAVLLLLLERPDPSAGSLSS